MRYRVLAALVFLLIPATALAQGGSAPRLAGTTWHTVRIEGDGLFFVIRDIGIRFDDDTHFTAAVRFFDGHQSSKKGTYRVMKDGSLRLSIEGLGREKALNVRRAGRDLIVRDQAFDVTLRLAPGKMEEEHWF